MSSKEYWKARNYFLNTDERCKVWESLGIRWHMHHIDPSWKNNDPERYEQWNIEDLLPMTISAHNVIHKTGNKYNLGKHFPEEWRRHIREHHANFSGSNHPMYGKEGSFKGKHHSEETKKKISKKAIGNTNATGNTNNRGKHWYNNGIIELRKFECPEGFVPGRLKRKDK